MNKLDLLNIAIAGVQVGLVTKLFLSVRWFYKENKSLLKELAEAHAELDKARAYQIKHVHFNDEGCECHHCGRTMLLACPMPPVEFASFLRGFLNEHQDCQPPAQEFDA